MGTMTQEHARTATEPSEAEQMVTFLVGEARKGNSTASWDVCRGVTESCTFMENAGGLEIALTHINRGGDDFGGVSYLYSINYDSIGNPVKCVRSKGSEMGTNFGAEETVGPRNAMKILENLAAHMNYDPFAR